MWYLGGKRRQAKQIVQAVELLRPDFEVYVEPFCGAMWSAVAMIRAFPGRRYILSDANPYLMTFWTAVVVDGWYPPPVVTEVQYDWYRRNRPENDPMTGYVGFAMSFGGKFFGGWARNRAGLRGFDREVSKASLEKIRVLRSADVEVYCSGFEDLSTPDGSMVYLDPPYEARTRQSKVTTFNRDLYYEWAGDLAGRCTVVATEFVNPRNWPVLYDYGDTVVRHLNGKSPDGTRELLLHVQPSTTYGKGLFS